MHHIGAVRQVGGLHGGDEVGPERRSPFSQVHVDRLMGRIVGGLVAVWNKQTNLIAVDESDAAVGRAEGSRPDPHDLAAGAQLVEITAAVAVDPGREHVALDHRSGECGPLHLGDRLGDRVDPTSTRPNALPGGEKASKCVAFDGLDLAPKRGQRATPKLAQDLVVAKLPLGATGPELTPQQIASGDEAIQRTRDAGLRDSEPPGDVTPVERAVGPGVTTTEIAERIVDRLGEHRRQTDRERHPHRIAKAGRVVARSDPIIVGDADLDGSALFDEGTDPVVDRRTVCLLYTSDAADE